MDDNAYNDFMFYRAFPIFRDLPARVISWNKLVRFVGGDGEVHRGEPNLKDVEEIPFLLKIGQLSAKRACW